MIKTRDSFIFFGILFLESKMTNYRVFVGRRKKLRHALHTSTEKTRNNHLSTQAKFKISLRVVDENFRLRRKKKGIQETVIVWVKALLQGP